VGFFDHEDFAIKAGVHVRPVAVFRIDQHLFVLFNDVNDVQFHAELFGDPEGVVAFGFLFVLLADGVGVAFDAEAGEEVDAFHMDALIHNDLAGEHGVQSTGDQ